MIAKLSTSIFVLPSDRFPFLFLLSFPALSVYLIYFNLSWVGHAADWVLDYGIGLRAWERNRTRKRQKKDTTNTTHTHASARIDTGRLKRPMAFSSVQAPHTSYTHPRLIHSTNYLLYLPNKSSTATATTIFDIIAPAGPTPTIFTFGSFRSNALHWFLFSTLFSFLRYLHTCLDIP